MAYYVILRRQGVDVREGLLGGAIPAPPVESILTEDLRSNLAGLVFNVTAALGQQLLLANPINEALTQNDSARVQQLLNDNGNAFWAVLEGSVSDGLADISPIDLANIGQCVENSVLADYSERPEYKSFIHALLEAAKKIGKWTPLNHDMAMGISAIAQVANDVECARTIMGTIHETLSEIDGLTNQPPSDMIGALATIANGVGERFPDALPEHGFQIPVDPEGWLATCQLVAENEKYDHLIPLLHPACEIDEIYAAMSEGISQGQMTREMLRVASVTQNSMLQPNWLEVVKATEQRLQASQNVRGDEAAHLLELLSLLRRLGQAEANDATKRLVEQGHLAHCMHHVPSQKNHILRGWCLATYTKHRPGFAKPGNVGNSEPGFNFIVSILDVEDKQTVKAFIDSCGADDNISVLWRIIDKKGYVQLLIQALRLFADGDSPQDLFTVEEVVHRWQELETHLNDDTDQDRFCTLIANLNESDELADHIQRRDEGFEPDLSGLYLTICQVAPGNAQFAEWCSEGLRETSEDQWKQALNGENYLTDLAAHLVQLDVSLQIGHGLQDALVDYGESILDGADGPTEEMENIIPLLVQALVDDASRVTLKNRLLSITIDRDGEISDKFFMLFGDVILDRETLLRDDRTVLRLFSPLLRSKNQYGLQWLAKTASTCPDILDNATDTDSVQDFKGRVAKELAEEHAEDYVGDSIEIIAENWDITALKNGEDCDESEGESEDIAETNGD